GVELGAQAGGGFVHQVDRLVGEEAVGDVAVREGRGRNQRGVLDLDAVVHLVALPEPAQDRDGVLDRGLVDQHGLEAALEGRVLLDVLAVLVQRGRADAVQLAAGEHGLQQVGGVHRALGRARADHRVQLVDEEDDVAARALDLLQDGLQALLELAAELGAGDQRAHVERDDPLLLESLGHVALDDALREALDDRRLADTGLADQHRVVLGAAGEDLDDAPDLVVAPDDRVELPLRGERGEVAAVLLGRLVGGRGSGGGAGPAASSRLGARPSGCSRRASSRCSTSMPWWLRRVAMPPALWRASWTLWVMRFTSTIARQGAHVDSPRQGRTRRRPLSGWRAPPPRPGRSGDAGRSSTPGRPGARAGGAPRPTACASSRAGSPPHRTGS